MTTSVPEKKKVKIGEYVLTGKIGEGGIAEIFRARQESLNRDVAIKILNSTMTADPDIVRRFERESIVIASLNHPNIVHIIDRGIAGGRYYFVMVYIDGTSLREVIDSNRIPLKTKLEMIVQVTKGLDYAHKNGVIHRDIKPANILIDRQGNAMVADFGIAQIIETPEGEMTSTDIIMGTMSYMSPEQKVSSTNVDQTTDIYAVGVILYEILVGKKPQGHFKLPSNLNPNLDRKFDNIILKCLAQEPKDRYQTAVELKDAILEATEGEHTSSKTEDFSMSGSSSFLGKCRYLDTIKETRFGSTILVENKLNKKLYIIKKHKKGDTGRKEANLLKSLNHDNILRVFGAGGDRQSTVVITDYAQGGSLVDRMIRNYEWKKAFNIILQVFVGLDFAHKNNIVHGDIRPSNILFDADDVIKLSDFGMPLHYDEKKKKNWYFPPERRQSRQGDIYGVGVILHQMIIGSNPRYDSGNNVILNSLQPKMPEEACQMLSRMLAIRAARRYQSCEEFLLDWDEYDQRRKDKLVKKIVRAESPEPTKNIPLWVYILVGLGIIGLILVVLYFSGQLR